MWQAHVSSAHKVRPYCLKWDDLILVFCAFRRRFRFPAFLLAETGSQINAIMESPMSVRPFLYFDQIPIFAFCCTSLAYFDLFPNLDFLLVEKYRSKQSLGQSKVDGSKFRKGRMTSLV